MSAVIIRKAESRDATGIAEVHTKTWITAYEGIISESYLANLNSEARKALWLKDISEGKSITIIAEDNGIIGFASGGKNRSSKTIDSEIYSIYLMKEHHGKGVGKQLFARIVQSLISEGFRSLEVWVLKENKYKMFYKCLGGNKLNEREIQIGPQVLKEESYVWKDMQTLLANLNEISS